MTDGTLLSREMISRSIRLPRVVLVTVAVNSLLWRGFPTAIQDALSALFDPSQVVLTDSQFGFLETVAAGAGTIGLGFTWLLAISLIYLVVPRLLSGVDGPSGIFDRTEIKLVIVILVVALAHLIAGAQSDLPLFPSVPLGFATGLVWLVSGWGGFGSVVYLGWWRHAEPTDRIEFALTAAPGSIDAERRAQLHAGLSRTDWVGPTTGAVLLARTSALATSVCFFVGVGAGIAVGLFPLAELLVLAGIGTTLAGRGSSRPSDGHLAPSVQRVVNLRAWFDATWNRVTSSLKGPFSIGVVVLGFVFSSGLILVAVVGLLSVGWIGFQSVRLLLVAAVPVRLWNVLGVSLCLAIPGLYSLWFWAAITVRLPHFLASWEDAKRGAAGKVANGTLSRLRIVRRPRHYLLPATVLWIPVAASVRLVGEGRPIGLGSGAIALTWPVLLAGVVWIGRRTLRAEPAPPETDGRAIQGVFVLQLAWLWLLHWMMPATVPYSPRFAVGAAILFLVAYHVPNIWLSIFRHGNGYRR